MVFAAIATSRVDLHREIVERARTRVNNAIIAPACLSIKSRTAGGVYGPGIAEDCQAASHPANNARTRMMAIIQRTTYPLRHLQLDLNAD